MCHPSNTHTHTDTHRGVVRHSHTQELLYAHPRKIAGKEHTHAHNKHTQTPDTHTHLFMSGGHWKKKTCTQTSAYTTHTHTNTVIMTEGEREERIK